MLISTEEELMSLDDEIGIARKEIISDGYEMSVGEVMNLYRDGEIFINPVYQRLFRWDESRKTRFIESVLLGIPIPPIFVYQNENGVWELIDGLQRLSTILQFAGILKLNDGNLEEPLVLEGTRFLPSLANSVWTDVVRDGTNPIDSAQERSFKRARLRVEILKQESDPDAKFELFQRLNTGGISLSEQEVRNCVAVMVDPAFHDWLANTLSVNQHFHATIRQTETALDKQMAVELALRFLCFRHVPYKSGLDVHEYLDDAMMQIIKDEAFNRVAEQTVFQDTFEFLHDALGDNAFRQWNGRDFTGKFLMSVYEVVATGVSKNIDAIRNMDEPGRNTFLQTKAKELWTNVTFNQNSGAGVRGTTRLTHLLPIAEAFFSQP